MKATKEGKLIKTIGDILGDPKVQKTIKKMVKSLLPITERTQYCIVDCGKEICQCKPTKTIQMNKELTAMQILIDGLESRYKDIEYSHNPYHYETRGMLMELIHEAKYLLQKEQEQIEKAFDDGVTDVFDSAFDKDDVKGSGKDYYQSKYGGEDVDR